MASIAVSYPKAHRIVEKHNSAPCGTALVKSPTHSLKMLVIYHLWNPPPKRASREARQCVHSTKALAALHHKAVTLTGSSTGSFAPCLPKKSGVWCRASGCMRAPFENGVAPKFSFSATQMIRSATYVVPLEFFSSKTQLVRMATCPCTHFINELLRGGFLMSCSSKRSNTP